ncbi:MAG: LysM domain-containing protein [Solirubrobacteraceae bacterium]
MAYRSPARWLAPLALLGSVAAIMVVISSSNGSGEQPPASPGITGSTSTTDETGTDTTTTTTTPAKSAGRRFYVVKEGDVLSVIADTTGVPLDVIEELNSDVDAQSLRAGQRIKLRP